jgi:hypothetical protein
VTSSTETSNSSARNARHADDAVGREAGDLVHEADHGVERIGDHDDEGVGRVLLDALAHGADHLGVDAHEIVARHAGLARHTRGHDHHVGAFDVLVAGAAGVGCIETRDRRELGDVERLTLGRAFRLGDVEQDDVAQFLLAGDQCEGAANLSGADQRDLLASHAIISNPVNGARGSAIPRGRQGAQPHTGCFFI